MAVLRGSVFLSLLLVSLRRISKSFPSYCLEMVLGYLRRFNAIFIRNFTLPSVNGPGERLHDKNIISATAMPNISMQEPIQNESLPISQLLHSATQPMQIGTLPLPYNVSHTPIVSASRVPSELNTNSGHALVPPQPTYSQQPQPTSPALPFSLILKPLEATSHNRYNKLGSLKKSNKYFTLRPGSRDFENRRYDNNLDGWITCIHPEGNLYFYHEDQRIFTDTDVRKEANRGPIRKATEELHALMAEHNIEWEDNIELVLELKQVKDGFQFMYYFVETRKRCLFWVHQYSATSLTENIRGLRYEYQFKYAMESQYWMHCELFPHNRTLTQEIFNETKETVVHAISENIMSDTSLAPFQPEELTKLLDLMGSFQNGIGRTCPTYIALLARLNRQFARSRFFNFYGDIGARLDADKSIYEASHPDQHSMLLRVLNPILFGAPSLHTKGLQGIWVDRMVNAPRWKNFISKLNTEWNGFTIYSTVMLAVDVSFMAVPGVDDGSQQSQSVAVIAIYLSTLNAVGSLVVSLILSDQSRNQGDESLEKAVVFLSRMTQSMFGTEALGIMYSFPYALLMWAMIWFMIALSCIIFQSMQKATLVVIGVDWAIIAIMVLWPLYASAEIQVFESLARFWKGITPSLCAPPRRKIGKASTRTGTPNSNTTNVVTSAKIV
ncbi:hypothetical protein BJ138DRAFT_1150162 [Hygrophoropsis aurantiaca]|uniref:Uncharacterized protein n=1 Tax=Hygrophoropsis aurantiaca TaxID=72124 RepID=A0ACB8ADW6_9AGAM|nr:hypothetical protein BJ138DRAFT_1150162 [Hygrophoropsis aurantiaca]